MKCVPMVVVGLSLVFLVLSAAGGQAEAGAPDEVIMTPVVVTASREANKTTEVPAHVTVIDAADIETSNARNVPELLGMQAGIHVSDISGNRRNYQVDLRGFIDSAAANTLVLVDGRRINQPDLSNVDWTLIPLARIERIEILRGGRGSVLYGDNAAGGVINILTKEGRVNQASVKAEYGAFDTIGGSASASAGGDRWALDLSGGYLESDGFRDNSATEAKDAGLNVSFDPLEKLNLHLGGGYHSDETRLPGALKDSDFAAGVERTDSLKPDDFSETEDYFAAVGLDAGFGSNDNFKLDTAFRRRDNTYHVVFEGFGGFEGNTQIDTVSITPQLVFREDFGQVANRVIIGYDWIHAEEEIVNTSFAAGTVEGFELEKETRAFYIQDELQVAQGLSLSGGYRRERAEFNFAPSTPSETTLKQDVADAGVNYTFGPNSHVYASYAKSYRFPLLDEMFNFFFNTIDTELTAQKSDHYEIGFSHQLIDHLLVKLAAYRIETEDEIFYNKTAFANMNLDGDTLRHGAELILRWQYNAWEAGGSYSYIQTEIDGGQFDGKEIPDVPEHQATADIAYTFDFGLRTGLNAQYMGRRYFASDYENDFRKQDDFVVVNANLRFPWRWLTFFVNLNNILDEQYAQFGSIGGDPREPSVYPSPEFNILAGVSARFSGL